MLLAVICFVLIAGFAFGDEYTMESKGGPNDPDSLINTLDPGNAPAQMIPAHKGLMGLNEEGLPGAYGSAAGGRREIQDTFLNYLNPSNELGETIQK